MTSPLHASYYADQAVHRTVRVTQNVRVARDTYRVRFTCPEMAALIRPGQFIMVRLAGCDDPLIGRPLALYDTVLSPSGLPEGIDVVYLVGGKMTRRLMKLAPGQDLDVWGPLGNGFAHQPTQHLVMVAGGIGQTPFLALARQYLGQRSYGSPPSHVAQSSRVTLCYGARTAELLAGVEDFASIGVDVRVSTDDGSQGHHGLVIDLLEAVLAESSLSPHVVCCGPEPMMEEVTKVVHRAQVPCQVSLETPMACGIGICFSCVARVRDQFGHWDYKRTCVEGPVFDASAIEW